MPLSQRPPNPSLGFIFALTSILREFYILLGFSGEAWMPSTCISAFRARLPDTPGYCFEVMESSCQIIAKDNQLSVFAARSSERRKILLFQYDPGNDATPTVSAAGEDKVKIVVPVVSQVFLARDHWLRLSVEDDFGKVEYPDVNSKALGMAADQGQRP